MAHAHKKRPPTQAHTAPPERASRLPRNMGVLDRGIRVGVALLIGLLFGLGELRGTTATVFGILALVLLLTSAVGTSPLYLPFGIDTRLKTGRR